MLVLDVCSCFLLLVVYAGADIEARNRHDETPLHLASESGHTATVDALVQAGAEMCAVFEGFEV